MPLTFFKQMARCVRTGNLVSVEGRDELPRDFAAQPPQTDARFVFFAGARNRCFLPVSQQRTFRFFEEHAPGKHALHVLPDYAHLDVFIGKNASRDVFPQMLDGSSAETVIPRRVKRSPGATRWWTASRSCFPSTRTARPR